MCYVVPYFRGMTDVWQKLSRMKSSPQVPWWNKRTRMERRGMGVIGILVVVSVCLGVGVVLLAKGRANRVSTIYRLIL